MLGNGEKLTSEFRANSKRNWSEKNAKLERNSSECRAFHRATEDKSRANRERHKPFIITLHTRTGHASVS